jgi:hypothetical protein
MTLMRCPLLGGNSMPFSCSTAADAASGVE